MKVQARGGARELGWRRSGSGCRSWSTATGTARQRIHPLERGRRSVTIGRRDEADISLAVGPRVLAAARRARAARGRVDDLRRRALAERHVGQRAAAGRPPAARRRRRRARRPHARDLRQPGRDRDRADARARRAERHAALLRPAAAHPARRCAGRCSATARAPRPRPMSEIAARDGYPGRDRDHRARSSDARAGARRGCRWPSGAGSWRCWRCAPGSSPPTTMAELPGEIRAFVAEQGRRRRRPRPAHDRGRTSSARATSSSAWPARASTTRTRWRRSPKGQVARISPLVPGIDLAGTVVEGAGRGRPRCSSTATTSASPTTAATRSTRACPASGSCRCPTG